MAVLEHVFRSAELGPLRTPHRIVMGSMHLGLEGLEDGGGALAAFYAERARAGASLIVTGGSAVSRVGAGGRGYSFVNEDREAAKLRTVAGAVHEAGAAILLQLFHAGRYAYESSFGLRPVAPSAVYSSLSRSEPRPLAAEEVEQVIGQFADGAARARELGFDGVEIMGSEGYLLNQFTAPLTNRRQDDWGGDAERRMRFPLAVAAAVRSACGPDLAVVYRISGADLVADGTPQEEVLELARRLSRDHVDALNVGIGWHEARVPTVQALVPHGAWRPWARMIREAVTIPVIASNRINTLELAEEAIAAGDADLVSLARPFLADPELVAKAREGYQRPVNPCIACNQACIDRSIFDRRVSCVVNPRAGYELELRAGAAAPVRAGRAPSGYGGSAAVVGGGPAGMEAARALAAAGHRVELFEAGEQLGGQFRMACRIPGKEDFAGTIAYFERELARLGVRVRLGEPVLDPGPLEPFETVVVATGVRPRKTSLPGSELPHVRSYGQLLLAPDDPESLGERVAIIGAGGIGIDIAHLLSHRPAEDPAAQFYAEHGLADVEQAGVLLPGASVSPARRVTVMCRSARPGRRIGPTSRWAVLAALRRAGVEVLTGVAYRAITDEGVVIADERGAERLVAADSVIVAAGQEANAELAGALERTGRPHVVIGGAAGAAELDAERAFREGAGVPQALALATGAKLVGSQP